MTKRSWKQLTAWHSHWHSVTFQSYFSRLLGDRFILWLLFWLKLLIKNLVATVFLHNIKMLLICLNFDKSKKNNYRKNQNKLSSVGFFFHRIDRYYQFYLIYFLFFELYFHFSLSFWQSSALYFAFQLFFQKRQETLRLKAFLERS